MPASIRLARADDARPIHAIYAPLVAGTAISFTLAPPAVEEIGRRIARTLERWPWLVCVEEGVLLGYAHAGPDRANRYQTDTAYDWSVEVSVYVRQAARRRGVARGLYTALLTMLRHQGFVNAYASITLPNPASVALHESMGFERVGVFRGEGYKLGAWHDVGWWHRQLRARPASPQRPVPLAGMAASPAWNAALRAGEKLVRTNPPA